MANRKTCQGICALAGLFLLLGSCTGSSTGTISPTEPPLSPTATATLTSTPTPTAIPTLPTEEAYALLEDYLQNNGGCELPCWWGITPGLSELQDVRDILAPLRGVATRDSIFSSDMNEGTIDLKYVQDDNSRLLLNLRFVPYPGDTTIAVISVTTQVLRTVEDVSIPEFDSPVIEKLLGKYTLQTVLQTYGIPAQLSIYVNNSPFEWSSPDFFFVYMLYPDSGIFLRYTSSAEIGDDKAYSRPTESFINMWLVSPAESDSYKQVLSNARTEWESYFSSPEECKSTEEALGMTEQEFFETILQTPEYRFESPLSIWPPFP